MTAPDPIEGSYALVVDELTRFDGGLTGLGRLISRLEPLIEQFEEHGGGDRVRALRREWGQLEIMYALALDGGRSELTDEEERDVAEIVDGIRERSQATGGS